jgi:hypothetical protein
MAKYISNNKDSFIDINGFNSEEEGADLNKQDNNDSNLTIPLSNTPLGTIIEEDKEGDRPVFGP